MSPRYLVRPMANADLDDQALFLALDAGPAAGHRFLLAAHETFALLAAHPAMGWRSRLRHPALQSMRVFRVAGFPRMLVLYLPFQDHIEVLRVVHGSRDLQALLRREGLGGAASS